MIEYIPKQLTTPPQLIPVVSAWCGLERVIEDIQSRFGLGRELCLEFGVDWGYSTVALSNYFSKVTGVDWFKGDPHAGSREVGTEQLVRSILTAFPQIELIADDYAHFITTCDKQYDLIHVDIIHTYEDTFKCGRWAIDHAPCVIFHDTDSFPGVRQAVEAIAEEVGAVAYNYPKHYGLGIIFRV